MQLINGVKDLGPFSLFILSPLECLLSINPIFTEDTWWKKMYFRYMCDSFLESWQMPHILLVITKLFLNHAYS